MICLHKPQPFHARGFFLRARKLIPFVAAGSSRRVGQETRVLITPTAPRVCRALHLWLFLLQLTSKCRIDTKWCDFRIESKSPRSHFDSTATLARASRRGPVWETGTGEGFGWVGNEGDQRRNSRRWAPRKVAMVITEGKADGRCEKAKTIMKMNEAMA